jgi:hypothetical protein
MVFHKHQAVPPLLQLHEPLSVGNWYRFKHQVGGQLPESCVDLFRCGTQAPIWMNGHHPTGQ